MTLSSLIQDRFGLPYTFADSQESNQVLEQMLHHKSYRHFTDQEVPEDLLQTLFSATFSCPSKSDLQQVSVIHVKDKDMQQQIGSLNGLIDWAGKAPVLLIWCGDSRRIRRLGEYREHPFANDHLDAFMNAAVDAGIAMSWFIAAAESKGLGCCPVSEVRNNVIELSEILKLPEHVFPVAGLAVGYPDENPLMSMRLPLSVTVHTDTYDDSNLIEEVKSYDVRREEREKTPESEQYFLDEFGVSNNYGWSEKRTRQYALPARTDFGAYIRSQGFNLE